MAEVLLQLIGGILGGSALGKIIHTSDLGLAGNALIGAISGMAGGQLIGVLLGSTAAPSGFDVAAIIGPLMDGAVAGGLMQATIGRIRNMFQVRI